MANRIHKTLSGDTLTSLAKLYYACKKQDGSDDDIRLGQVISRVRSATAGVTDLTGYTDTADLGAGLTILIPTLRSLAGALFAEPGALATALAAKGFESAAPMLKNSVADVLALLGTPSGWTTGDLTRSWTICGFLDLDGMDTYTAAHLYDVAAITSLDVLKVQSEATIDGILATLVASPHNRPAELATQGHATRWPTSAWIRRRTRVSDALSARSLPVPIRPGDAEAQAAFYERRAVETTASATDAELAGRLGLLYRFQAAILRGNVASLGGQSATALKYYADADAHFHRLAERTGAATAVSDAAGLTFTTVADTIKRVLEALPAEEDHPLGAPRLTTREGALPTRYRLRGFRYAELSTSGTDRKAELRGSDLASKAVHTLPSKFRGAISRGAQSKTRGNLGAANASATLTSGLAAAPGSALSRELEAQDKSVLLRNLASVTFADVGPGSGNLDLLDAAGNDLPICDVAALVGTLWASPPKKPDDVLSTAAKAAYPSGFLTDSSLTPFTRFVALPDVAGATLPAYVAVDASFATRLRDLVFKPRGRSARGADAHFEPAAWTSAGSFCVVAAWLYCQLPLVFNANVARAGLGGGVRRKGLRTNLYATNGDTLVDVDSATPSSLATQFETIACATDWSGTGPVGMLLGYLSSQRDVANLAYHNGEIDVARQALEQILCAIESADAEIATDVRSALYVVHAELGAVADFERVTAQRDISLYRARWTPSGGPPRRFGESWTRLTRAPTSWSVATAVTHAARWFEWTMPAVPGSPTLEEGDEVEERTDLGAVDFGIYRVWIDQSGLAAQLAEAYLWAVTRLMWLDLGLNRFGLANNYVPPWSFDHLYGVARDLGNRALEMESQVLGLMQAADAASKEMFQATAGVLLAGAQLALAMDQEKEAGLAKAVADAQADLAQKQANQQAVQAAVDGVAKAVTSVAGGFADDGDKALGIVGAVGALVSAGFEVGFAVSNADDLKDIAADTKELTHQQTTTAASATAVAQQQSTAATEWLAFLDTTQMTSEGWADLLAQARDTHELYIEATNRAAWLAQRALTHETRQPYDRVKTGYATRDDKIRDLTRAQRIVADLELTRAQYVTGGTQRRQEAKLTLPLSVLAPGALKQLRDTGACTFTLSQRVVDGALPGLLLHSVKDVQVAFLGTLPPTGVAGVLRTPGLSWIRVPNDGTYLDGSPTRADWVTAALARVPAGRDTAFDGRSRYLMRALSTQCTALSLSLFDVRSDRAVLQVPQGMLGAVQHLGLDTPFTLEAYRQANAFAFTDIRDVELTFWFLATFDAELAREQYEGLVRMGLEDELQARAVRRFASDEDVLWSTFVGDPLSTEALDLRALTFTPSALPAYEASRLVTNLLLAVRREGAPDLTIRLCSSTDPVGVAITLGASAVAYTDTGVTASASDPDRDEDLQGWLDDHFYDAGDPIADPEQTFVIKVQPETVGTDWHRLDDDGAAATTLSGPLVAPTSGTATYDDGAAWTHTSLRVKAAHEGGTILLKVRVSGTDSYALEIGPSQVRLLKSGTLLGEVASLAYPTSDWLDVELRCWTDPSGTVHLRARIDGLEVLSEEDASAILTSGTVGLSQASGSGSRFDDVEVRRLTRTGADAEVLLTEPFTTSLPSTWTFTGTWTISSTGHNRLDLSKLLALSLQVDYRFQMVAP